MKNIDQRIEELKIQLNALLVEKRDDMIDKARGIGCICGFIIDESDVSRLVNIYCRASHKSFEKVSIS